MKKSIAIADIHAKPDAFVVWRGFEESIKKASHIGYDGIELALKGAEEINPPLLSSWLKQYNMEVSAITTGQIFSEKKLYMTMKDEAQKMIMIKEFFELIKASSPFTDKINIGRCRGCIELGDSQRETEQRLIHIMRIICDYALTYGMKILIEPVNRYECNFINTLKEAQDILCKIDRKNCGIHADLFHMNIEEPSIENSLVKYQDSIKYIHVADSNRYAPGMGHLNLKAIFDILKEMNYHNWVSVEILPIINPDEMAIKSIEFLKNY